MIDPSASVSTLLRITLDGQLQAWKDERAALAGAAARIADLDALIAFVEADNRTTIPVDPKHPNNGNGNGNGSSSNPRA